MNTVGRRCTPSESEEERVLLLALHAHHLEQLAHRYRVEAERLGAHDRSERREALAVAAECWKWAEEIWRQLASVY